VRIGGKPVAFGSPHDYEWTKVLQEFMLLPGFRYRE